MSKALKGSSKSACLLLVRGRVQGVGFRPHVYRIARSLHLSGSVANSSQGARIEIEGSPSKIANFVRRLRTSLPRHAHIDSLEKSTIPPRGARDFVIQASRSSADSAAEIPADLSICDACLGELFTAKDRRYRYPFINCTQCGPRFSLVKSLPYDRPKTTMIKFKLCPECRREYTDPLDRRFHAQPNACPVCGPRVTLMSADRTVLARGETALSKTRQLLQAGRIIAVKSLGGYHLACDPADARALQRLRDRKDRPAKPFAFMVRDLKTARTLCILSPSEEEVLSSPQRPIVLARKNEKVNRQLLERLAPGNANLGILLPYTPLHYLLFDAKTGPSFKTLVMTSGNRRDEPICVTEDEAFRELSGIADYFLVHDRPIHNRLDDSIVMVDPDTRETIFIRRSRGYVPGAVSLNVSPKAPSTLAVGAELKNTFCLTRGNKAFVSPYIGDLNSAESLSFFEESLQRFKKFLDVSPRMVARDLHPDYLSTRFAAGLDRGGTIAVQHHHAHIASVLAEKEISSPVIGFAFDGTGYGVDGTTWGGECFLFDGSDFSRAAHFQHLPLPGGDRATKEIWRTGIALLRSAGIKDTPKEWGRRYPVSEIEGMITSRTNCPLVSSLGRIFDGVAALLGLRSEVSFEAQAAMELERIAQRAFETIDTRPKKGYNWNIVPGKGLPLVLSTDESVRGIWKDLHRGCSRDVIALKFHQSIAEATGAIADRFRSFSKTVILSGGVFQNRLLLHLVRKRLEASGFRVETNTIVPPNDGGVSLGQAWLAIRQVSKRVS